MSEENKINIKTTVKLKKIIRIIPNDQHVRIRVGHYYIDGVQSRPVFHQILSTLKDRHAWKISVADNWLEVCLKNSADEFIKMITTVAKSEFCELYVRNKPVVYIDGKVEIISINSLMDPIHVRSTATLPHVSNIST